MSDQFLGSPILPGKPIEHHEHRRLVTVLVVVVISAIAFFFAMWWGARQSSQYQIAIPVTNNQQKLMHDQAIAALTGISPATPADIQAAVKQLTKQKPMSDPVRAQALKEAVSQLKAK